MSVFAGSAICRRYRGRLQTSATPPPIVQLSDCLQNLTGNKKVPGRIVMQFADKVVGENRCLFCQFDGLEDFGNHFFF